MLRLYFKPTTNTGLDLDDDMVQRQSATAAIWRHATLFQTYVLLPLLEKFISRTYLSFFCSVGEVSDGVASMALLNPTDSQ